MRGLPTAVRMHILTELACFATPMQVVASTKQKFDIDVSRQCVEAHHPERRAGAKLNPALRALFYETRAKLRAELDGIGIAHQSYRLRGLERMLERAEGMGNIALALQLIEQAAREVGGMYERRDRTPPAPDCQLWPNGRTNRRM